MSFALRESYSEPDYYNEWKPDDPYCVIDLIAPTATTENKLPAESQTDIAKIQPCIRVRNLRRE